MAEDVEFSPGFWECYVDGSWIPYGWITAANLESLWLTRLQCSVAEVNFSDRGEEYLLRRSSQPPGGLGGNSSLAPVMVMTSLLQVNTKTGKDRGVQRWRSAAAKTRALEACKDSWKSWDSSVSSWIWPIRCKGSLCKGPCVDPSLPFLAPAVPAGETYVVFPESTGPGYAESFPYPIRSWPPEATLCVHPAWTGHRRANFAAYSVPESSEEWQWLCARWKESGLPGRTLVGVLRIMNRSLVMGFHAQKILMREKLKDGADFADGRDRSDLLTVKYLWHGTPCAGRLLHICQEGFDRAHAKMCVYGKGCYFASRMKTSDTYACSCSAINAPNSSMRVVVLSAVLCGEMVVGTRDMYPPPEKPHSLSGERYENMVDNTSDPAIIVTAKDNQAMPAYLVAYR